MERGQGWVVRRCLSYFMQTRDASQCVERGAKNQAPKRCLTAGKDLPRQHCQKNCRRWSLLAVSWGLLRGFLAKDAADAGKNADSLAEHTWSQIQQCATRRLVGGEVDVKEDEQRVGGRRGHSPIRRSRSCGRRPMKKKCQRCAWLGGGWREAKGLQTGERIAWMTAVLGAIWWD